MIVVDGEMWAEVERQGARLAAVEALADSWERMARDGHEWAKPLTGVVVSVRAALASAPEGDHGDAARESAYDSGLNDHRAHDCCTGRIPAPLAQAIRDVCWKAQPYGEDAEGFVTHYLLSVGPIHRLVGAAQGVVPNVALRNPNYNEDGTHPTSPNQPKENAMNDTTNVANLEVTEEFTIFAADVQPGDTFVIPSRPPYTYDFNAVVESVRQLPMTIETPEVYFKEQPAFVLYGTVYGRDGHGETACWMRLERETIRVKRSRPKTDAERITDLEAAVDALASLIPEGGGA